MLWDLNEGKHLYTLDGGGETINALCFSPNRYWLCAATGPSIKIWVRVSYELVDSSQFLFAHTHTHITHAQPFYSPLGFCPGLPG